MLFSTFAIMAGILFALFVVVCVIWSWFEPEQPPTPEEKEAQTLKKFSETPLIVEEMEKINEFRKGKEEKEAMDRVVACACVLGGS